jgi:hypothetical protein
LRFLICFPSGRIRGGGAFFAARFFFCKCKPCYVFAPQPPSAVSALYLNRLAQVCVLRYSQLAPLCPTQRPWSHGSRLVRLPTSHYFHLQCSYLMPWHRYLHAVLHSYRCLSLLRVRHPSCICVDGKAV